MEHSCVPGPYPSSCATLVCVPTNRPPHARGRTGSHGAHNCESTGHQLHPATLQSDTTSDHQHHETPAIFFLQKGKHKIEAHGPPTKILGLSLLHFWARGPFHPNHKYSPEKKCPPKTKNHHFPQTFPPKKNRSSLHQTTEDATGLSILRSTHGKMPQLVCHQVAGGGREVRHHLLHLVARPLVGRPANNKPW